MGRELIFKLRRIENSESTIECEDYVCGRDDCTNYIAQQILDDGDDYSLVYKLDDKEDCLKLSNLLGINFWILCTRNIWWKINASSRGWQKENNLSYGT